MKQKIIFSCFCFTLRYMFTSCYALVTIAAREHVAKSEAETGNTKKREIYTRRTNKNKGSRPLWVLGPKGET